MQLTPNTQAILLLTAPLVTGRSKTASNPLSPGEYKRLTRILREHQRQPADLVGPQASEILQECQPYLDRARLEDLLGRGFLLSQAIERWQSRAIWVISRADAEYPKLLKKRLREDAPPILYGCGDAALLDTGGLAVVGSRNVDEALIEHTEAVGRLAAAARRTVVSGGARGVDQAAMRGALEAGGRAVGVLADSLDRAALARENRDVLMNRQLVLITPYDPAAGFNVGHAMQRNKLIYGLADAALVVSSDFEKGGTWAGAVEQLDKLRFVNVYVRSGGETGKGLAALLKRGALPWPNPATPEALGEVLDSPMDAAMDAPGQEALPLQLMEIREETAPYSSAESSREHQSMEPESAAPQHRLPADELFAKVRELLGRMETPKTETGVAEELQISKAQAREWLDRLVKEGVLVKLSKPARYCSRRLF